MWMRLRLPVLPDLWFSDFPLTLPSVILASQSGEQKEPSTSIPELLKVETTSLPAELIKIEKEQGLAQPQPHVESRGQCLWGAGREASQELSLRVKCLLQRGWCLTPPSVPRLSVPHARGCQEHL